MIPVLALGDYDETCGEQGNVLSTWQIVYVNTTHWYKQAGGFEKRVTCCLDRENAPHNPSANEFSFLRSAELYVFESRTKAS